MTFLIFCHLTDCLFLFFFAVYSLQLQGERKITLLMKMKTAEMGKMVSHTATARSLGIGAGLLRWQPSALFLLKLLSVLPLIH